ncbi:multiple epidermal growth factor-like domains protein 11 [Anopheles albimanus]|uniref:multiple epidermal growth factor-like domains protein 11 n=1 Tax=Anopheles albimanus TaxID=7167 RepID=UPI00163FDCF2|nr:multiple epidermal growth factor-like domains protein 11 [Anopheles albimanus]
MILPKSSIMGVTPWMLLLLAVICGLVTPARGQLITVPEAANDPVVESVCFGVNAGIFPHPDPALCHIYISCTFERPIVYQCAAGLVFEASSLRCVPGDREQCGDRTEPEWTAKCAAFSYAFFADPNECWKFVFCALGTPTSYTCPTGEVWSQQHGACMAGNRETCEVFDISNICRGQPDGLQPHPESCTQFVRCTDGVATGEYCPVGEIFTGQECVVGNTDTCQPESDVCRGVAANDLRPHPNECHLFVFCSPQSGPTVLICPPNEIFRPDIRFCVPGDRVTCEYSSVETACVGRPPGVVPHPTSCQLYLSCNGGVSTVLSCPDGSIFNPQTGSCAIGDAQTCLVTEGLCTGQPDGLVLEHPFYCGMFLICQGGQTQIHDCPAGEILRVESQFCAPGDVATCELLPVETMCSGRDGGFLLPHPTDCALFVACVQGQADVRNCQTGHIFNAPTQSCKPGNAQDCTLLTGVCAGLPEQTVLPHPDRCDYFIWCLDGQPSINPCPAGQILRPEAEFCVPGNPETCVFDNLEDLCLGQPNYTLFPHPTQCFLRVVCMDGVSTVQSCPTGSVYHAPSRACLPGNPSTCEVYNNICVNQPTGPIPNPSTCVNYIHCEANRPFLSECPSGLIFDPEAGRCRVGNTETCEVHDPMCTGVVSGTFLEHPNLCNLYVWCLNDESFVVPCADGLIFNVDAQICVPGNANTCLAHPVETMCEGAQSGIGFPHPDGRCTEFIICGNGQPTLTACLAGFIFHPPSQSCVPGNTVTCELIGGVCANRPDQWVIEHPNLCGLFIWCIGGDVQIFPCPDREILRPDAQFCVPGDASTCAFDPVERMCEGRNDGLVYPHPTDCRQSVRCSGGVSIIETCRPGTIYRASTQSCVAGNGNTCEFLDSFCVGRPDAVLPHPEGCALFLMCTSGVTTALQCPEGEILHPEHLVCVAGNAEDCSLSPVTTEPPIISVCEGRPDGNYTHPLLCYLFIRCTAGVTEIMTCPPNHIFLGALRDCAPGDQSTCIPF